MLITYIPANGPSSLRRHPCAKNLNDVTSKQPKISGALEKIMPSGLKSRIADAAAVCAAKDMRPLSFTEGDGFVYFLDTILKAVAKETGVYYDPAKLLSCGHTNSRHAEEMASSLRVKVKKVLLCIDTMAITVDHWDHSKTNQTYITVTTHYVKDGELIGRTIATQPTDSKSSDATEKDVENILTLYSCADKAKIIVSDNCPAMKKAFVGEVWIGCSAHQLNTVLKHTADPKVHHGGPIEDFHTLIDRCSYLVSHVKRIKYDANC